MLEPMKTKSSLIMASVFFAMCAAAFAGDVDFKLTTNNGSTTFNVLDSLNVAVATVTSDGDAVFNSVTVTNPGGLILNTASLQSGSTFYVSSGTVSGQLSVDSIKFPDGTVLSSAPAIVSRSIMGHWGVNNLTASQTNLQLTFDVAGNAQVAAGSRIKMPYAGIARGSCVSGSAARTAGTATFQIWVNGVDVSATGDAIIDATNTQFVCSTSGTATFVVGDILDIRVTTNAAFAPTTTEYTADLIVEWSN